MRISGNYHERLFISVLPYTIIAALITAFFGGINSTAIIVFFFVTGLFWLIDTIIILCYRVKPLIIENGLYIGKELINPSSIVKIVPFESPTGKWRINMLQFLLDDGRELNVLEKPYPIYKEFSNNIPSKTRALLFEHIPKLKTKLRAESHGL